MAHIKLILLKLIYLFLTTDPIYLFYIITINYIFKLNTNIVDYLKLKLLNSQFILLHQKYTQYKCSFIFHIFVIIKNVNLDKI